MRRMLILMFVFAPAMNVLAADEDVTPLLNKVQTALKAGDTKAAIELAKEAVKLDSKSGKAQFYLGEAFAAERKHIDAIAAYDKAFELDPKLLGALDRRGGENFKLGKIEECMTDFEKYLKARPDAYPGHWRFGIACFYAGRFADGAKQFKAGEVEFGDDVENVFWHYLCNAKLDGVEKAREKMLKLDPSKPDRRVGFMEIYELIQGKSTPEKILAIVEDPKLPDASKTERMFYAHLYIGLNYEAEGNKVKALEHLKKADALKIGHYMWDVGHVHLLLANKK